MICTYRRHFFPGTYGYMRPSPLGLGSVSWTLFPCLPALPIQLTSLLAFGTLTMWVRSSSPGTAARWSVWQQSLVQLRLPVHFQSHPHLLQIPTMPCLHLGICPCRLRLSGLGAL